ncbi:unnamed protein product, partial [Rotaria sp. Silwood2]
MSNNALLKIAVGTFNIDASSQNSKLTDGGTHEAFFTVMIRSLLEELVRFNLHKGSHIRSEQYEHVLRELLHNLEAYHLLTD